MVIQGGEDPTLFLESLPYSSQWNVGPVNRDNLAATAYARVRQPYIARFRTIPLPASAVIGAKNVSILLPESLQVMLSCYLRIELAPCTGSATYRKFVGARILRDVRILSAGQQVMSCDFRDVMVDYLTNLERSAYESFVDTHLGGRATEHAAARTILLPIPLWNSAIFARSHTGHLGAIPAAGFSNNRLEFILDFADARDLTVDHSAAPAFTSITMEIHEALMPSSAMRAYARQNGNYSLISRAMRRLGTTDNQLYTEAQAAAEAVVTFECASPAGSFEEIIIMAVRKDAAINLLASHNVDLFVFEKPTSMSLVCDSRNVRVLDKAKAELEMYSNGFTNNEDIVVPIRFCLGSHTRAYGSSSYCGAFAFDAISNVQVQLSFDHACFVRILGICKARYSITTTGEVRQSLR